MRTIPWCVFPILLALFPMLLSSESAAEQTSGIDADRTLLLVDDHHVLYRPGTRRELHPLKRHDANPVIPRDKPWEVTVAYCSVHRDDETGKFQLWYQAYPRGKSFLCYATSDDGIHWTKPNIGLFEFKGSKDNNILLETHYGGGVIHDPHDEDPSRRYKFAYWDLNGTCVAFSPDGIHWTKYPGNPVIRGSHGKQVQPPVVGDPVIDDQGRLGPPLSTSDVTDPIWDPIKNCYAIYAKTWLDGPDGTMHWKRAVVRTDSKDFIHWTKPVLVAAPDEFDDPDAGTPLTALARGGGSGGAQLHSGPAFAYNGMYFSTLQLMGYQGTGFMPLELAISRDGYDFQRPFRDKMFLPSLEDKSQFDAGAIWSNATPLIYEDEIHFYYGAYGNEWSDKDFYKISGIGLATMKRDRFAGVQPTESIGQITMKEIDLSSVASMTLNADASGGSIRVEILNADGYRMPGFTKDDAIDIKSDDLRHQVAWKEHTLGDLPKGDYRLRIHLKDAEVFALTLNQQ